MPIRPSAPRLVVQVPGHPTLGITVRTPEEAAHAHALMTVLGRDTHTRTQNRANSTKATTARRSMSSRADLTIKAALATERQRQKGASKHAIATRVARRLGVSVSTVKRRF